MVMGTAWAPYRPFARCSSQRAFLLFPVLARRCYWARKSSKAVLTGVLNESGDHEGAVRVANRADDILVKLDPESEIIAGVRNNRGEALTALERYSEAARDFEDALRTWRLHYPPGNQVFAHALQGLGEVKRGEGDLESETSYFEQALRIRERSELNRSLVAYTRFSLSQCLWKSDRDRPRARALASSAADIYADYGRTSDRDRVLAWLAQHRAARR